MSGRAAAAQLMAVQIGHAVTRTAATRSWSTPHLKHSIQTDAWFAKLSVIACRATFSVKLQYDIRGRNTQFSDDVLEEGVLGDHVKLVFSTDDIPIVSPRQRC